ncbi:MAG: STAS domain-containing protein [Eubacteriales bacterium]|nr:STAS domain-containing protein [Eubacteriales bacterium]
MTITKTTSDGTLTLLVEGRLDANTSPQLEAELDASLDGVTNLTFDLNGLVYISSAGLRVLLACQKLMTKRGNMRVIHVCDAVMDVFKMTGFTEILTLE